jgi:hypothetical protein
MNSAQDEGSYGANNTQSYFPHPQKSRFDVEDLASHNNGGGGEVIPPSQTQAQARKAARQGRRFDPYSTTLPSNPPDPNDGLLPPLTNPPANPSTNGGGGEVIPPSQIQAQARQAARQGRRFDPYSTTLPSNPPGPNDGLLPPLTNPPANPSGAGQHVPQGQSGPADDPSAYMPMEGIESTSTVPTPKQFQVPGITFPVSDLNPKNSLNNCVFATMAACLNQTLPDFLRFVKVSEPTDPKGVPLDFINFMLSRTDHEYMYVSPFL